MNTRDTWKEIDKEYYRQLSGKPPVRIRVKLTKKVR